MRPHVVADVGNSRVKWGVCAPDGGVVHSISLPEDPDAWRARLDELAARPPLAETGGPLTWVLASVRPGRSDRLRDWLEERGHRVVVLSKAEQLPLEVRLDRPDAVGIDRLLNAVAAKKRLEAFDAEMGKRYRGARTKKKKRLAPHTPAVLVDAGSAITVDLLDQHHAFRGGSIFPGLRLMAQALHDYTALLPLVEVREPVPALPGTDTVSAMEAGILHATIGGIERITWRLSGMVMGSFFVYFTGGDAALLHPGFEKVLAPVLWPTQTLEGIVASVEALPDDTPAG